MIQHIELNLFKCFQALRLPIGALTLLSGGNASGKSTVLQALVLIHQTMNQHEWSRRLMLNGNEIRLGTVTDAVDQVNGRSNFSIGIADEANEVSWTFSGERSEMSMAVEEIFINGERGPVDGELRFLLPANNVSLGLTALAAPVRGLTYITAERMGPREVYEIHDTRVTSVVGPFGQYAVSVLFEGRDEKLEGPLALEGVPPTRLRQVEERMRRFFPGCAIDLQKVNGANAVTLGIRTSPDTDFHRTINVGFGLTQVFPLIVAALSASKGDILLIENPEVHLHPSGQAAMGEFLAEVSNSGVQVLVETHSDHLLNGVRKAVKAERLSSNDVVLHFFRPRSVNKSQVESPQIDQSGNIDYWPEDFFDQFEKDLSTLVDWN